MRCTLSPVLLPNPTSSLKLSKFSSQEARMDLLAVIPATHCLGTSRPTPPLLRIRTVLLELFVSRAVTGSPQRVEAHRLLCSIIHTSFKCLSLQPLVTPCHLPGRLSEVSTLPGCFSSSTPSSSSPWPTNTPSLASRRGHHFPAVFFTFPKVLTSQKHLSGICQ